MIDYIIEFLEVMIRQIINRSILELNLIIEKEEK